MDLSAFLKTVPAVIGFAGLLTYFMRKRAPESGLELVNVVQNLRNRAVIVGCAALILLSAWLIFRAPPPDHDAARSTLPAVAGASDHPPMAIADDAWRHLLGTRSNQGLLAAALFCWPSCYAPTTGSWIESPRKMFDGSKQQPNDKRLRSESGRPLAHGVR